MIALFELFLRLTCLYDIRRKMQIYGAHAKQGQGLPGWPVIDTRSRVFIKASLVRGRQQEPT